MSKPISRREFMLSMPALAALISCKGSSPNLGFAYELKQRSAQNTASDVSNNSKARTLADYVIKTTKSMHTGIKSHEIKQYKNVKRTEAIMVIDGVQYSVILGDYADGSAKMVVDVQPNLARFIDDGIDGKVTDGYTSHVYSAPIPLDFTNPDQREGLQMFYQVELENLPLVV